MFDVYGRNSLICIENIDQLILLQVLEKEVDLLLQRDNTRPTDVFATLASKMFDNIPDWNDQQTLFYWIYMRHDGTLFDFSFSAKNLRTVLSQQVQKAWNTLQNIRIVWIREYIQWNNMGLKSVDTLLILKHVYALNCVYVIINNNPPIFI